MIEFRWAVICCIRFRQYSYVHCYSPKQDNVHFKGTVRVYSSEPLCKDEIPDSQQLVHSDQYCRFLKRKVYDSDIFLNIFSEVEMRKSLLKRESTNNQFSKL